MVTHSFFSFFAINSNALPLLCDKIYHLKIGRFFFIDGSFLLYFSVRTTHRYKWIFNGFVAHFFDSQNCFAIFPATVKFVCVEKTQKNAIYNFKFELMPIPNVLLFRAQIPESQFDAHVKQRIKKNSTVQWDSMTLFHKAFNSSNKMMQTVFEPFNGIQHRSRTANSVVWSHVAHSMIKWQCDESDCWCERDQTKKRIIYSNWVKYVMNVFVVVAASLT